PDYHQRRELDSLQRVVDIIGERRQVHLRCDRRRATVTAQIDAETLELVAHLFDERVEAVEIEANRMQQEDAASRAFALMVEKQTASTAGLPSCPLFFVPRDRDVPAPRLRGDSAG